MNHKLNLFKPIEESKTRYGSAKSLKLLCDILEKYGQKHWIDWGTLLGAYREGKIIDDDFDIDMGCIFDGNDYFTCPYHGTRLYQVRLLEMLQEHFYIRYFIPNEFISVVPIQQENFNVNHVDIGFYNPSSFKLPNFREFFIDELETIKLYDMDFPCPRHTEAFVEMRYGNDWKIPIKGFSPKSSVILNKERYICYVPIVGDLFHIGHLNLLKRCKHLFDKVIVGVHNDVDVEFYKCKPVIPYEERVETIKSCIYVDSIYENAPPITTDEVVDLVGADYVVAGREDPEKIAKMYPVNKKRLHLIKRTENISSTEIKKRMS
jgi:cytidyltransferase-like protein